MVGCAHAPPKGHVTAWTKYISGAEVDAHMTKSVTRLAMMMDTAVTILLSRIKPSRRSGLLQKRVPTGVEI